MKSPGPAKLRRAVGAARRAISAALDTRFQPILPEMLNSAGSVSAEWYVETLWRHLAKQGLLKGVSGFDVEFRQPARLEDRTLHFALPHPESDDVVMDFHVLRTPEGSPHAVKVSAARIAIHRRVWRRRHGVAPDPPRHPYGIEIRTRHLNSAGQVSWYTLVAATMDVSRRGAQFADEVANQFDASLRYIVPGFTFIPLADAAMQDNLFVYPAFELDQPWVKGKTSAAARVTLWAVANREPWPLAESVVTVVRTTVVEGVRRAVDERGRPGRQQARPSLRASA